MRKVIFFLFLYGCQLATGQQLTIDPATFDYSKADSIAIKFSNKNYKSYKELVRPLTENLETEHEKVRVLFRWITENISYNYANKSSNADVVVKSKKAVCIGYSTLLKKMCEDVGIDCEIISGYSKITNSDILKRYKKTDHAWNAVKLYDNWYLIDVTWATGYYLRKKRERV